MKKILTSVICFVLCISILGINTVTATDPTPEFICAEDGVSIVNGASESQIAWSNFNVNLGDSWTISGEFSTLGFEGQFYRQILAKGVKDTGHFEVYLDPSGYLSMYIFDGNGSGVASACGPLDDGNLHAFCFVGKDNVISIYVDGAAAGTGYFSSITNETETFRLGDLVEMGMPITATEKRIAIYTTAADSDLAVRLSTVGYVPEGVSKNADPTPDFICAQDGIVLDAGTSESQIAWENFTVSLGETWAVSGEFSSTQSTGFAVLLAKGPKDAGHFEVYLTEGHLSMYFPDSGQWLTGTTAVADGSTHAFCFLQNDGILALYVDGEYNTSVANPVPITPETETLYLGSVPSDWLPYTGSLKSIRIFNSVVSSDIARRLSTVNYVPVTILDRIGVDVGTDVVVRVKIDEDYFTEYGDDCTVKFVAGSEEIITEPNADGAFVLDGLDFEYMSTPIDIILLNGEDIVDTVKGWSVNKYLTEDLAGTEYAALAADVSRLGSELDKYHGGKGWETSGITEIGKKSDYIPAENPVISNDTEDKFTSAQLYIDDTFNLRFNFVSENAAKAVISGPGSEKITITDLSKGYVMIENIPASEFNFLYTVELYGSGDDPIAYVMYSVADYVYNKFDVESTQQPIVQAIAAVAKSAGVYN